MDQSVVINFIVGIASALISSGLVVEWFRRRGSLQDQSKKDKKELTAAELDHEKAFIDMMMTQIDRLTQAERSLIDERINVNREIDRLQGEVRTLTILNGEQDEEIAERNRKINELTQGISMRDSQILRLQQALANLGVNNAP